MVKMPVGDVAVFLDKCTEKDQAMKPLEEASEVLQAWKDYKRAKDELEVSYSGSDVEDRKGLLDTTRNAYNHLMDECADTITAVCNLMHRLNVVNPKLYMERCEDRNRARGRL